MNDIFPKEETRSLIVEAISERFDNSSPELSRSPALTYVPTSHARALNPESTLVVGIRGAGKSHWWSFLSNREHRKYLIDYQKDTRLAESVEVVQGFGGGVKPDLWPDKDIIRLIMDRSGKPRHIWQAVIAVQAGFPAPFPILKNWEERVDWISKSPEEYARLLSIKDQEFKSSQKSLLIIFDSLDRLADDWRSTRPLARELMQLALDMRATNSFRLKLFVRPDMLEDKEITGFTDYSKLDASKAELRWSKTDLFALFFHLMGNSTSGDVFREHCKKAFELNWNTGTQPDIWMIPTLLRSDEEQQRRVFHAISGPFMGEGKSPQKRGFPYTWLGNHLQDGRSQVSPRSLLAALRFAADFESPAGWEYALSYKGIAHGVTKASSIRVNEIKNEEYPWVDSVMSPLKQKIKVPCGSEDIIKIWNENHTIEYLQSSVNTTTANQVKLPPVHIEEGASGVLRDLAEIGIIYTLHNKRIQMPDVYRIAFGIGRYGGVKPLK